ncbi:MAG: hypothetical protein A3E80_01905 [Chlamydiae bacterium RIFCSPHIGHO2_12_FULL_49_9]|nr:MAG: hypothetical protein A3E80_01905 [Chlamydiae bacterium RIFCSPHIGHO2_12_FULL_49_9]
MKKFGSYLVFAMSCFAVSSVFANGGEESSEVVVIVPEEENEDAAPRLFGCGCGQKPKKP